MLFLTIQMLHISVCTFRFLRKEKEIAEARLEIVQAESNRYKYQTEQLTKQLDEAVEGLTKERQIAQVCECIF